MQEGIAHVCLVLASMTLVKAKIEMHIPRKRKGNSQQHDKVKLISHHQASKCQLFLFVQGVEKFFDSVLQAILRHVNFDGKYNFETSHLHQ